MTSKINDPIAAVPPMTDDGFVEVIIPVEVQEMDRSSEPTEDEHAIMMGAAAAGGCIGCLVGGPFLACLAGVGSAYGTTRQSAGGDCTRSMGKMALSCRGKAIEVNDKHQVVAKTKTAAYACWEKSKDTNERHKIMERTKGCMASSWEGMKEANRNHRIVDRTFAGIGVVCNYVNDKIIGGAAYAGEQSPDAAVVDQPASEEGESRTPPLGGERKGSYVAVKTGDS